MSSYGPYYGQPAPAEAGTSWTAIFALIIAVIAVIIIIVVVYIVVQDRQLITNITAEWRVVEGSSSVTTFDGGPNSVFVVPSGTAAGYGVTISAYTNIATYVTATSSTIFRIDNSQNANSVNVLPATSLVAGGRADNGVVPPHSVYEYQWTTGNKYRLVSWSIGT